MLKIVREITNRVGVARARDKSPAHTKSVAHKPLILPPAPKPYVEVATNATAAQGRGDLSYTCPVCGDTCAVAAKLPFSLFHRCPSEWKTFPRDPSIVPSARRPSPNKRRLFRVLPESRSTRTGRLGYEVPYEEVRRELGDHADAWPLFLTFPDHAYDGPIGFTYDEVELVTSRPDDPITDNPYVTDPDYSFPGEA